jgi:phage gp36-like protein
MSYCTVPDVRYALTQAAEESDTNTAADMDDATIQDSIDEASSIIDLYVDGPYLSTDTKPGIIKYWCRDIAAYLAASVWRKSKDWTALDPVYLRWQGATQGLQAVASGTLSIPTPASADEQATLINQYDGTLIHSWEFDLTGMSYPTDTGFPLYYYKGWLWWPS